ncbi:MAG: 4-hydroxythreonine-4-phosphate dehydrogenase PdxA [Hyphomicrobiaceae bacterium]
MTTGSEQDNTTKTVQPLAVTIGEPAGIGPDILIQSLVQEASTLPALVVYGAPDVFEARARALGVSIGIDVLSGAPTMEACVPGRLTVRAVGAGRYDDVGPGRPSPRAADAVVESIEQAVADVVAGHCAAIVTNPINKAVLYEAGFKHPGHTEFLGELAGRHYPGRQWHPVMMLASDMLRVVPLTIHVPLSQVPGMLTPDLIVQTARIVVEDMVQRFSISAPRIVVAGLNPHAGESGSIGREDMDIIAPAVAALRGEGIDASGPLSADTMFHPEARQGYDVALCMYHDQALIPIKALSFDDGVNVTLGLPFVRTSPDHGTAFDIAGTGRSRPASLIAALRMARQMADAASGGGTP